MGPLSHNYSVAYDTNPSECYRAKPLITAILNEDFQVEVGNMWADAGGEGRISNTFNSLRAQNAPYQKEMGGLLGNLLSEIGNYTKKGGFLDKAVTSLKSMADSMGDGSMTDNLNSALITQGTKYSYYGGTTTTFGNLTMRFTLFADWLWTGNGYKFRTVHDQLREIYPYAVGKYYPLDLKLREKDGVKGSKLENAAEAADKAASTFFGWQQPPGGFQADVRSLDSCQKGTLRLVLLTRRQ